MDSRRIFTKSNKGFTLVEMVIAVAFLAIISITVLQLFINAKNMSLKAHDLDHGVQISKSILEIFDASENPDDFTDGKLFNNSSITRSGGSTVIRLYYNKDWKVLGKSDADLPAKSAFLAVVTVGPAEQREGVPAKEGLYKINITVEKMQPYIMERKFTKEVYHISADKYFSQG